MTTLMMILMIGQESPGEALQKFAESIEKKDFDAFARICTEKVIKKMGKEDFDGEIQKTEKRMSGHFLEGMKKGPTLGAVGDGATQIELRWKYAVAEGLINIRVRMTKTDAGWRVFDFNPRLEEKGQTKGASGKTASSPAQAVQAFIAAIEKKEYDKAVGFLFEPKELPVEQVGKEVAKEEEKNGGHWLEGLKRAAVVEGGDEALAEIDFSLDFDVMGGRVEVELKYVKGKTDWKLRDIESDFKKAK